jgi:uncharacterized protein YbjT (DUF2867 family)
MKVALIAGATGLIGKQLLDILLSDPEYHHVKAITRKPIDTTHPKLENVVIDFKDIRAEPDRLTADTVFCCLGTTMRKAGSKEVFRTVDFEYPLHLAEVTYQRGAKQFLLVSALGADAESSIYYNRVKGEVEDAIANVGFEEYHIFRPSLLLGPRQEQRSGEDAAKVFYKVFSFLIPAKYKAIESVKVARAMAHFARKEESGKSVHESASLQVF